MMGALFIACVVVGFVVLGPIAAIHLDMWAERRWPFDPGPPLDLTNRDEALCSPKFIPEHDALLGDDGNLHRPWVT